MKIRQGDTVKVISGSYRGKEGRVLKVINSKERLVVEGINMLKRHMRPSQENPQGGIIEKEGSIHISNVQIISGGKSTRVGYKILEDGKKARFSKTTGKNID
jgi:large subunit ribosomal protein L24